MTPGTWLNGCANCMTCCLSCGTNKCAPASMSAKFVMSDDGATAKIVDNRICFCLAPTLIPCCMYCGFGPLAQIPHFKKVSDTVYEGTGDSMLATGACKACCHNAGDTMELKDGGIVWAVGKSPAYPPCFQGKEICKMKLLVKGGAPTVTEMVR